MRKDHWFFRRNHWNLAAFIGTKWLLGPLCTNGNKNVAPLAFGGTPGPLDSHYYTWIQRKCPYTLWPTLYDAWRAWRFDEGGSSSTQLFNTQVLRGDVSVQHLFYNAFWNLLTLQGRVNCQYLKTDLPFGGFNTRQPKIQGKISMYGALEKCIHTVGIVWSCIDRYMVLHSSSTTFLPHDYQPPARAPCFMSLPLKPSPKNQAYLPFLALTKKPSEMGRISHPSSNPWPPRSSAGRLWSHSLPAHEKKMYHTKLQG